MADLLMIGDSFMTPTSPQDGWKVAAQILGERLGLSYDNRAIAGAGHVATGNLGPNQRRRYTQQVTVNASPDPRIVIIFGSVNDSSANNIELCLTAFLTFHIAMQRYPNAKHLWIGPQWSGPNPVQASTARARDDVLQAVWGLPWQRWMDPIPIDGKDMWFPPNRPDFWTWDKFHPGPAGQVMMADRMEPQVRDLLRM